MYAFGGFFMLFSAKLAVNLQPFVANTGKNGFGIAFGEDRANGLAAY